ncbi:MAG: HAMP domain-containing histidine kinase [Anaerolineae bacterium]|nr:HAMP domain-containing histidine kinase [Anaerolineae bacterium]
MEIARRIQAENALRQANTELQTRNKELDAFAHTVAHDLKNPLSIITSYGEILSRVGLTMSPKELELIFGEVQKSARKATNIIEELLLLASSRKEAVTIRSLNMEAIVAAAQARLTLMIQESQAETLYPQHWPRSLGYGPWVEEVWVNYLSNGLKYGGVPPRLELGATRQENDMIRFWVRDNGAGLSPQAQALLFTEFTRLDEIQTQGHGLGLSILRHIVKKLGGQVGVESNNIPRQGCTFYFTLAAG